ncbi:MAG TPA: hypothetical protein VF202_03100 [Trueperaceae bacterium]|jgi:hypothetical protein
MKVEQRIERQPVVPGPFQEGVDYEVKNMVVILTASRYAPGMFRRLAELLRERIPKVDSPWEQWQLSDNLEDTLQLVLFTGTYMDRAKRATAEKAMEEVTGAAPSARAEYWNLEAMRRVVHGNAQAARDAKEEQQAA